MIRHRMPRGFNAWVAATVGADLGAGVLAFALTWVASGYGPAAASAVLTLTVAPTVVFGLLGGAVADRFGARRVMIICTAALMLISATLALVVGFWSVSPAVLMVAAAAIGTVSAFHRPAVGVFPRLFVSDGALGTAMARVGMASQVAGTLAPPLGGLLIGMIALNGVAWIDVLGCLVMVAVLLLIHPPLTPDTAPEAMTVGGIVAGLTAARRTSGVPTLLLCVGIVAGAVLPAVFLGIPLAARERGWSAAEAGLIEAGWIAGGLVVGLWFSWRGTAVRAWRPMAAGAMVVAVGLLGLALSPTWTCAVVSTCIVGAGVVIFTAHVFPTYVLLAPASMLSRFQSLLILVQRAPQLVINPLIGVMISVTATGPVLAGAAVLALVAAVIVASDRTLRSFVPTAGAPHQKSR
ncbi:MFS transporter [Microbacterium sp. H1-D42]|uniref:MFS transporter n=1 Tax=Microbacterium sp. H1-D42 TaxID=2925844 RepID=UPI001F531483|nr:MFS transporter [Microbacterium sp. H1-D42]UNK70296.1 MFS transporter [Microbacterium sp. H1-D42]